MEQRREQTMIPIRHSRFAIRDSSSGFTLIELVLVCAIIGVMVGLAATRLDLLVPKYRLRAAAREVASVLKQGKARAAAQGKDIYFEIDLSQGKCWLLAPFPKPDSENDPRPVEARPLQYEAVFIRALPDGVHFIDAILGDKEKSTSGKVRVRLSAFGASSHVILNLINSDDNVISIKFNGFTGMISYLDEHQDAEELLEDKGT
jgi:prepilin-type N-terminal cleavage/methylation domain-containing protein